MNIFSILLTSCLVGLCNCKGSRLPTDRLSIQVLDDYAEDEILTGDFVEETRKGGSSGRRLVWDLANGTVYEEEYIQPSARRRNTGKVEYLTVEESAEQDGVTLDLTSPDKDECEFFEYSFVANTVKLIVPNKGVSVSKLVNGSEDIYTLSSGETFDHAKAYLNKDKKPELVLVVTRTSGASKEYYLELKDGKWTVCDNHGEKMLGLRVPAERTSDIDLSFKTSTDQCTIFETELLGVTTKHFYPKPGHVAIQVKDGNEELWNGGNGDYCLSCLVYRKGNVKLLEIIVVENSSGRGRYFERNVGGEWRSITEEEYDQKLADIKGNSGGKSSVEDYKEYLNLISTIAPRSGQYGFETPQFVPPLADYSRQHSFSPPPDPKTLDLASLTDPRYKTVDVDIAGAPARVYIINHREDVKEVKYNGKEVWKAYDVLDASGYTTPGKCAYCITFLRGTGTAMILVNIHNVTVYREIFRYKEKTGYFGGGGPGWSRSITEYAQEIAALKTCTGPPTKFTLDISSAKGNGRFKLKKSVVEGITIRYYSSKPGNLIEKVVDGSAGLWNAEHDTVCYLCELHSKGTSKLLRIHTEQNYKIKLHYFENEGSGWSTLKKYEFEERLERMQ
ncbi:hypothetical protein BEWA_054760 [Theileria equi strain WA]|uniref:Signal peptide containing protein n=1 Tax=Theileria equi strain WA TaxID=1537102 RepID=L1LDR5_THEEQ|nr:hypothetical protein BEWA_054760 [Theileria equi strain WA]EKX73419.1 hypothetical protein BEWA_054760 [Theileria equi strain WA]|eukprot:XP_004832871.1 hypothetical protein BEWA_054760 [Theileria equi strain WA]